MARFLPRSIAFSFVALLTVGVLVALPTPAIAAPLTVTNTNDSGGGSLRDAITTANGTGGLDTIDFNISGSGVHVISPGSALPDITQPVFIDGLTQTGASTGNLKIRLDGSGAGVTANGLKLASGSTGSTIRGIVIGGFALDGIAVQSNTNTITGNFLGTNAAGTAADANAGSGVGLYMPASNNVVGGTTAAKRNVLSGNTGSGATISGATATGNMIQGNYIGTDVTGLVAVANGYSGINVGDTPGNTIGGSAAGAGNVISANVGPGIFVLNANSSGNAIKGNLIGVAADGSTAMGNGGAGITVWTNSSGTIGGISAGEGNVVAFNSAGGVTVSNGATGQTIRGNSIYGNTGGLGIDLAPGANNDQASPVITTSLTDFSRVVAQGTLNSAANTTFQIDLYANPGGGSQAADYVASTALTTDGTGLGSFLLGGNESINTNKDLCATATSPMGDTSELGCTPTVKAGALTHVSDFQFAPSSARNPLGESEIWWFSGPSNHVAADASGMGMYNSGPLGPGATSQFAFTAAGTFPFHCTIHTFMTGKTQVVPIVAPAGAKFSVTWASAPLAAGFLMDVQVKKPGTKGWHAWKTGTTTTAAMYKPKAGHGKYSFRARLRNGGGQASYSPGASITGG